MPGGATQGQPPANPSPQQLDRFRSFAERYVIARAESFTKGIELEDGWQALQDAKKLYEMIARVPNPDAQRGDGAGGATAAARPSFVGHRLSQVVKEMTDAGVPQQVIWQYVNDAMAGKPVPPYTKFTQMLQGVTQARKG